MKATVNVGRRPQDAAFDPGTRTLYVANFGEDEPGTVSVVDTRACNARVTSGCGQTPKMLATGRGPIAVSVDPSSHAVYVADTLHATVSTLDGRTCNAVRADGCGRAPSSTATGYFPRDVLLDGPALYVTSSFDRTFHVLPTGDQSSSSSARHRFQQLERGGLGGGDEHLAAAVLELREEAGVDGHLRPRRRPRSARPRARSPRAPARRRRRSPHLRAPHRQR